MRAFASARALNAWKVCMRVHVRAYMCAFFRVCATILSYSVWATIKKIAYNFLTNEDKDQLFPCLNYVPNYSFDA